jgi:aminoglycoside phosphotransferase (APT) family kinase protein
MASEPWCAPPVLDLEHAARVLGDLLGQGSPVTEIVPLTTGFSNETYLVEGPDLILRLPPAAGAMLDGHDVLDQARIYQALAAAPDASPVPQVVLVCEDPQPLGAPFFLMQRVAGEAIDDIKLQPWFAQGGDAFRAHICQRWVGAFAANAKLAPLEALGAPVSPDDDARRWRAFAGQANCPQLVALFDRLLATQAPLSGPPAVVHGDTKLSNLMWQGDEITAMLDWEMALNGEPLADLGYLLYSFESPFHAATRAQKLPGMLSRAAVIALWEQVSGRSAEGVFWHEVAQIGKIGAIIAEGCNMWDSGRSSDPKLEMFKANIGYYIGVMQQMLDGGALDGAP